MSSIVLKWPDKAKDPYQISAGNLPVDYLTEKTIAASKIGALPKEDIIKALSLNAAVPSPNPFLAGIRSISPAQDYIILERPPTYKMISFTPVAQDASVYDQKEKFLYRIPIPWQVYIIALDHHFNIINLFMFFRKSPLSSASFEDELFYPYFTNFYGDSRVCKASLNSVTRYEPSIQGACIAAYEMIWSSGFNLDVHKTMDHYSASKHWAPLFKVNAYDQHAYSQFYTHLSKMTPQAMCDKPFYPKVNRYLYQYLSPTALNHEAPILRSQSSVISFLSTLYDLIDQKK